MYRRGSRGGDVLISNWINWIAGHTQSSQVVQSQVTYRKEGYLRKTIKSPPPTLGYLEPIREHAGMQTGDGQVLISLAISLGSPYMKRMKKKGHCSKA